MQEFQFTWQFALKVFSALLILGVWFMSSEQAKLDKSERQARAEAEAEAKADGRKMPAPARRIVPPSNYVMIALAIVFLVIALLWGNKSTL